MDGCASPCFALLLLWQSFEAARLPLSHRDTCGHLLVPLNKCRRQTYYMPFKCGHERHIYEECEYLAYLQRVSMKRERSLTAHMAMVNADLDPDHPNQR